MLVGIYKHKYLVRSTGDRKDNELLESQRFVEDYACIYQCTDNFEISLNLYTY